MSRKGRHEAEAQSSELGLKAVGVCKDTDKSDFPLAPEVPHPKELKSSCLGF